MSVRRTHNRDRFILTHWRYTMSNQQKRPMDFGSSTHVLCTCAMNFAKYSRIILKMSFKHFVCKHTLSFKVDKGDNSYDIVIFYLQFVIILWISCIFVYWILPFYFSLQTMVGSRRKEVGQKERRNEGAVGEQMNHRRRLWFPECQPSCHVISARSRSSSISVSWTCPVKYASLLQHCVEYCDLWTEG